MKKLVALFVALSAVAVTVGCNGRNPIGPGGNAPDLPPTSSMEIPSFGSAQDLALSKSAAPATNNAFTLAYLSVSYWTSGVQLALLQPDALFKICQTVTPVPLPDNSGWAWSVSNNQGFSARLTGRVDNNQVQWTMSVTGGSLVDFVWFTGTSVITGREGMWTFYDTAKVNGSYPASVQFTYAITDAQNTVKVTVVNPANPDFGSYLQWTGAGVDRSFEAFNAKTSERFIIAWNTVTEAGSITNVLTGEKACWDTKQNNHQDIVCQ